MRAAALLIALLCLLPLNAAQAKEAARCLALKNGTVDCLKAHLAKAEKKMEAALAEQQKKAKGFEAVFGGQRSKLEKTQKAFLKYREAECDYQSREFNPESMAPDAVQRRVEERNLSCALRLTQQRIEWLSTHGK